MSEPEGIEVDPAAGLVSWHEGGEGKAASLPGAFDARYDPRSRRLLVLIRGEGSGTVTCLSSEGQVLATIAPPEGYSVSHFAEGEGGPPLIVCQGESRDGGWWDWHFEVGADGETMRKAGPAY